MTRQTISVLLVASLLLLTGTALAAKPVEPGVAIGPKKAGFSVQLPSGWMYELAATGVGASRDGGLLNTIAVTLTPHDKAFKAVKKTPSPDTPAEELGETWFANLQAGLKETGAEVTLLSIEPAELGGRGAFRAHLTYRMPETAGGVQMEQIALGTATDRGVLTASYLAPKIHFFALWLPAFQETARSVKLDAR